MLRFRAAGALEVPAGAQIELLVWGDGQRQHTAPEVIGPYPFVDDIKLTVDARDGDGSRRFTVFAALTHEGTRLSWARVRTGFVQDELAEVRVVFAPSCLEPADRPVAGSDSNATCGSHDSCGPTGECVPSCVTPTLFGASESPTPPSACPEADCLSVDEIESGRDIVCVLAAGEAFCWGRVDRGLSTWSDHHVRPSRVVDTEGVASFTNGVTAISASADQVCLIDDGSVRCGGSATDTSPFLGARRTELRPCCEADVDTLAESVVDVKASTTVTFVIDALGVAHYLGRTPGELPSVVSETFQPLFDGRGGVDRILGQWDGVCAFRSGAVECVNSSLPIDGTDVLAADGAVLTACIISSAGELRCYGRNWDRSDFAPVPHVVPGEWRLISLARQFIGDDQAACAIRTDGSLHCWGDPAGGRTGDSVYRGDDDPVRIDTPFTWTDVGIGTEHACGVSAEGGVYCWGANTFGQLGRAGGSSSTPEFLCVPGY